MAGHLLIRAALGRTLDAGVAMLVAVALTLIAGHLAGLGFVVERTDSMRPAMTRGDVLLIDYGRAADLRRGDVVTFADPAGASRTITHRVVAVMRDGDRLDVTTRGDANPAPERWRIAPDGHVGEVRAVIPSVGALLTPFGDPDLRGILALVASLAAASVALACLWIAPAKAGRPA